MYDIPDDVKRSMTYQKLTKSKLSDLAASDVYSAIQEINTLDPRFDGYLKFLKDLWFLLEMNSSGLRSDAYTSLINTSNIRGNRMGQLSAKPRTANFAEGNISEAVAQQGMRTFAFVPFTLSGGVLANQEILAKLAAYFGCVRPLGIIADSADTYILTHQDEDDTACIGTIVDSVARVDIVVGTAYVWYPLENPPVFFGSADNKAIEVDISGGAGAEKGCILYECWYET